MIILRCTSVGENAFMPKSVVFSDLGMVAGSSPQLLTIKSYIYHVNKALLKFLQKYGGVVPILCPIWINL